MRTNCRKHQHTATTPCWQPAALAGSYISCDGRITAELRPAGRYDGVRLLRHYAIRNRHSSVIIGQALTLAEAHNTFVH